METKIIDLGLTIYVLISSVVFFLGIFLISKYVIKKGKQNLVKKADGKIKV